MSIEAIIALASTTLTTLLAIFEINRRSQNANRDRHTKLCADVSAIDTELQGISKDVKYSQAAIDEVKKGLHEIGEEVAGHAHQCDTDRAVLENRIGNLEQKCD